MYLPPLEIKLFDKRSFGVQKYGGVHILRFGDIIYKPLKKDYYKEVMSEEKIIYVSKITSTISTQNFLQNISSFSILKICTSTEDIFFLSSFLALSSVSSEEYEQKKQEADMKQKIEADVLRSLKPIKPENKVEY